MAESLETSSQESELEPKSSEIIRLIKENGGVQGEARKKLDEWLDAKEAAIEAKGFHESTRAQVNMELRLARIYEQAGRTESAVDRYRTAAQSIVWQKEHHKPQEQQFFENVLKPRINTLLGRPKETLIELDE